MEPIGRPTRRWKDCIGEVMREKGLIKKIRGTGTNVKKTLELGEAEKEEEKEYLLMVSAKALK